MMGNRTQLNLVEIGSLTSPHCKLSRTKECRQDRQYVKPGKVAGSSARTLACVGDRAANLIVRCNGVKTFFPLVRAIYSDQATLMAKIDATPQDKVAQIQNLPANEMFVAMATLFGLQDWAAARGVRQAKSNRCLSDQKMIEEEVQVTSNVSNQYPEFTGTPAFILNGKLLAKEIAGWDKLEPQLKDALN